MPFQKTPCRTIVESDVVPLVIGVSGWVWKNSDDCAFLPVLRMIDAGEKHPTAE
jgi:hypothetical protein